MPGIGGRHAPERVDDLRRNQWTTSIGISGRNAPEYADYMTRLPKNRPPTHPGEMLLKELLKPL
jgi:hypothetical protein